MKFELDYRIRVAEDVVDSSAAKQALAAHSEQLSKLGEIQGAIVVTLDGKPACDDQFDPLLRLASNWVRKLPWLLGGDTETVAFRDSEQCYAFVPTGDGVEFSLYTGSEAEVEEYIVEPTVVRLDAFVKESLAVGERLLELVRSFDPSLCADSEDCRDLMASLDEGRRAWRDYEIHKGR